MNRRTFAVVSITAVLMALAVAVSAHTDSGVDEPWSEAMNQEAYWELRFGGEGLEVSCTKFDGHGGGIPAGYEAVVTKGGNFVRVYTNVSGAFTALGPVNPNPGPHRHIDISWVMKCHIDTVLTTTSTTIEDTSTTTTLEDTSTTTTLPPTTTTLLATTTTVPTESSTTTLPATTTSEPATTTTGPSTPQDESARWTASGACYDDGGYIGVEWGDGIVAVDVYMWADIDLGQEPAGWGPPGTRFTEPGAYKTAVNSPTLFLLVPVVTTGYVADPAEIEVLVERCTPSTSQASSTSAPEAPQTPSTPDLDELPFTGLPLHVWAILGLALIGTGGFIVRRFSDA